MKRFLGVFLIFATAGFSTLSRAEISASLLEILARPVARTALVASADGAALAERLIGERIVLRPNSPSLWREQTQTMVEHLVADQTPEVAEELYLRLVRMEFRFRAKVGTESLLEREVGELTAQDILVLQEVTQEELALRVPGLLSRFRGVSSDLKSPLIFAPARGGAGAYSSASGQFLAGEGSGSAYDRSVTLLRELARRKDAAYMLISTEEGQKLTSLIMGPGSHVFRGDPAEELIAQLASHPEQRDLTIQLAVRLSRAVELVEAAQVAGPGSLKKAMLRKAARSVLVF